MCTVARDARPEITGSCRVVVFEADRLLVIAGVMDGDGGGGIRSAAVPSGIGDAPLGIRVLIQRDQCEVGRAVLGTEIGSGLELLRTPSGVPPQVDVS